MSLTPNQNEAQCILTPHEDDFKENKGLEWLPGEGGKYLRTNALTEEGQKQVADMNQIAL